MEPLRLREVGRLRILDFDTECRPMHYAEFKPESQLTAIAWSWLDQDEIKVEVLEQDLSNEAEMLARFLADYERADMVTGHYLRSHDLPLVNEHVFRQGWPRLKSVIASDTCKDIPKLKDLGKSQENLCGTLGLPEPKHHMGGHSWRRSNALTPEGREGARERVTADVVQNKALRSKLLELGWLNAPRRWSP